MFTASLTICCWFNATYTTWHNLAPPGLTLSKIRYLQINPWYISWRSRVKHFTYGSEKFTARKPSRIYCTTHKNLHEDCIRMNRFCLESDRRRAREGISTKYRDHISLYKYKFDLDFLYFVKPKTFVVKYWRMNRIIMALMHNSYLKKSIVVAVFNMPVNRGQIFWI